MKIERSKKLSVTIKTAFVEDGHLIDAETGETIDMEKLISSLYGESEVKIAITATSSEEIDLPESEDSEE